MKIIIGRTQLNSALAICSRALSKSVVVPIMDCYLFDVNGGDLTITACNNHLSISNKFTIENNASKQKFAIASGVLSSLIKQLPEQPLIFIFAESNLTITSNTGKYILPFEDGENFPQIDNKPKMSFIINGNVLSNAIERVLFSVLDNQEAQLGSILMEVDKNKMTLTGSNSHVLSTFQYPITSAIKTSGCIPKASASALSGFKDDVSVSVCKNSLTFVEGNTSVSVTLSDNQFPDYKVVIGLTNTKFITIDRLELKSAISRAKVFSNRETWLLRLQLDLSLTVTGEDIDFGQQGVESLNIDYSGEPLLIGCSGNIMAEALNHMESQEVYMEFLSANRAIIMRESKVEKYLPENLMLVMPMVLLNQ